MKLTIIVPDSSVYVDGVAYSDLSLIGIPANAHALQWQDTAGHIEFNDGTPNEDITALPFWAEDAYNVWVNVDAEAKKKAAEEAAIEAATSQAASIPLTNSQKLDIIRIERDKRLLSCDWTQLTDAPSTIDKAAWATYRQALRDLTNSPNLDLDNPVYPIPPM